MKILHCKFHILEFSFNKSCELGMNLGEQVVLQLYEKHHPTPLTNWTSMWITPDLVSK